MGENGARAHASVQLGPITTNVEAAFTERLSAKLEEKHVHLGSVHLGRRSDGPFWVISVQLPDKRGVSVNARVTQRDPYSLEAAEDVASRILKRFVGR